MIALPPATRVWLACGATDMRKGMCGLAVMAQEVMKQNPHSGAVFAFRGRRGDLVTRRAAKPTCYGMTARDCACSPSGSTAAGSSGR